MDYYGYYKNQYNPIYGRNNVDIHNNGNSNLEKFINFLEL